MDAVSTKQRITQSQEGNLTPRIWGRLLWKEWREDWPILLAGILLPLLTLPMNHRQGWEHFDTSIVVGLVSILVALWAADRARRAGIVQSGARIYLPAHAATRWVFAYLAPLMVSVLVGNALGVMMHAWLGSGQIAVGLALGTGMLFMTAVFLLCSVLTPVLSFIPALIAGVLLAFTYDATQPQRQIALYVIIAVAALVASLLWEACAARQRYWAGRVAVILLLLFVIVNPLIMPDVFQFKPPVQHSEVRPICSSDNALCVRAFYAGSKIAYWEQSNAQYDTGLEFIDNRRSISLIETFAPAVQPLDFEQDHVILAQQTRDEDAVHLLRWYPQTRTRQEIMRFRAERGFVDTILRASLSPDGHYLAILQTRFDTLDNNMPLTNVWVIDLKVRRARAVMIKLPFQPSYWDASVSWSGSRLYLSGSGNGAVIDLATMRGIMLDAASPGRMR